MYEGGIDLAESIGYCKGCKYDILRLDSCIPMVLTHQPLLETGEILLSGQSKGGQVDGRSRTTAMRLITHTCHAGGSVLLRSIFKSDGRAFPWQNVRSDPHQDALIAILYVRRQCPLTASTPKPYLRWVAWSLRRPR